MVLNILFFTFNVGLLWEEVAGEAYCKWNKGKCFLETDSSSYHFNHIHDKISIMILFL